MVRDSSQEFPVLDSGDSKALGHGRTVKDRTGQPRQTRRNVCPELLRVLIAQQIMREAGGSPTPPFVTGKRKLRRPTVHQDGDAIHVGNALLTGGHPLGRASIEEGFEQCVHGE